MAFMQLNRLSSLTLMLSALLGGIVLVTLLMLRPQEPSVKLALQVLKQHPALGQTWQGQLAEEIKKSHEASAELHQITFSGKWNKQAGSLAMTARLNPGQAWIITETIWIPDKGPSKKMDTAHEWMIQARDAAAKNDLPLAQQACLFISQTNPDDFRAFYCQGLVAILSHNQAEAAIVVRSMADHFPDSAVVQVLAADILKRAGSPVDAQVAYRRAFKISQDASTVATATQAALDMKDFSAAANWLNDAHRAGLVSVELSFARGRYFIAIDNCSQAFAALTEVVQIDPKHAEAWYGLGLCYQREKLNDQAQTAWVKSVLATPANNLVARKALSRLLIERANYPQAIAELKETLARHPNDAESTAWLTALYAHNGHAQDAQTLYEKLKKMAPANAQELVQSLKLPTPPVANNVKPIKKIYSF